MILTPPIEECEALFDKCRTPPNIVEHCRAVSHVAVFLALKLKEAGVGIDVKAVEAAALLHDICKMSKEHEKASANAVAKAGYKDVAAIIKLHNYDSLPLLSSWEEKVLWYADKRTDTKVISLSERIGRWIVRYPKYKDNIMKLATIAKALETEIFNKLAFKPDELGGMIK